MYLDTCKNMIIINKYRNNYTSYSYMYSYKYTLITLTTSKNEKYFYDYYNMFEYNHDSVVIVFNKNMIF